MRRFYFDRQTDVSGTSGTGAVVEGVQFGDGRGPFGCPKVGGKGPEG